MNGVAVMGICFATLLGIVVISLALLALIRIIRNKFGEDK